MIAEKAGPAKTRYVQTLDPDGERLMKTVFLGYTDRAVAGRYSVTFVCLIFYN